MKKKLLLLAFFCVACGIGILIISNLSGDASVEVQYENQIEMPKMVSPPVHTETIGRYSCPLQAGFSLKYRNNLTQDVVVVSTEKLHCGNEDMQEPECTIYRSSGEVINVNCNQIDQELDPANNNEPYFSVSPNVSYCSWQVKVSKNRYSHFHDEDAPR